MSILETDNHGAGPDPNAASVHVAVTAHPKATTIVSRAAEIQAATNKAYGQHLEHVREIGRKYSDEARGEVVAPLLKAFEKEPIWQQAIDAEIAVGQRVAELAREVEDERRALTPPLDTAGEIRQQRAIDRARGDLAKVEDGWKGQAAAKILRDASDQDVGILVAELPHLLPDDVPAEVLEPAIRERAPQYASAAAKLATAQQGQSIITVNGQHLRRAIGKEHRMSSAVLGVQLPSGNYDPDAT